ncbi:MAG: MBG domain-containing protein, partial [Gallionella sp.]|nr:MBG domain-containing protein [Gallionella sp.]
GYTLNDGNTGGNYTVTTNIALGTINKAALSINAVTDTKTYDGLAYSGGHGVAYSGFVNGETSAVLGGTLAYGGTSQGAINTGSYVITPNGLSSGNYTLSYVDGALTVNPAALSVTANAASKTYDGAAYSGGNGVGYMGFVNGETNAVLGGTLAYSGTSQGAINAGSYVITPGGLTSGNYTIAYTDGVLTVNQPTGMLNTITQVVSTLSSAPSFSSSGTPAVGSVFDVLYSQYGPAAAGQDTDAVERIGNILVLNCGMTLPANAITSSGCAKR